MVTDTEFKFSGIAATDADSNADPDADFNVFGIS